MEDQEWAWLAGIFEGEGCIVFTGKNSVTLSIGMTDRDVIDRVLELVGRGTIYRNKPKRGYRPQFHWKVGHQDDVRFVLRGIRPWLGKRRGDKADGAMERMKKLRKPGHCKRGHRMAGKNLYVGPQGERQCRACVKVREQERTERRRKASPYPAVKERAQ